MDYKELAEKCQDPGVLMMEIGYVQGRAAPELPENTGVFYSIAIEEDFANNDRIAIAKK